jgi:hypothetical protein
MIWAYSGKEATIEDIKSCVGPGWSGIIDRLVRDLLALNWDGELMQVKEKFGGLRFYIGSGSDAIFDRIAQAEEESDRTCETCGAPGKARGGGWILTLCDTHAKKL